jgi:hypothetical protein
VVVVVLDDDPPAAPGVSNFNVNGAWNPKGSCTATPLTVAANAAGAPATTVTGPVAATVCDSPAVSTPVKSTAPVDEFVVETQQSPDVADNTSE